VANDRAIDPNALPTQTFDWGAIKWFVTPDSTPGAALTVGEVLLLPGQGHARHNHPESEEILYVLSGVGDQMLDVDGEERWFPVKAGDAIYVETAQFHSTINRSWQPMRLLAVYNPGGAEKALEGLPDFSELEPGGLPSWTRG
jgi:oxalate decarboxylase/phosphoglucose isomerase-like protein (cupin superfamily)